MAGGSDYVNFPTTTSVELLEIEEDVSNTDNVSITWISDQWTEGPKMLAKLSQAASAVTEDQSLLFVAGGLMDLDPYVKSNYIFSLRCSNSYCWWLTMDAGLLHSRSHGVVMFVPAPDYNYGFACKQSDHLLTLKLAI